MKQVIRLVPVYVLVCGLMVALGLWGSRGVTAMTQTAPSEAGALIVLDPGHGAPDGGAVSCTGVQEAGINLEITRRLEALLSLLGYDTLLTRTGPDSVYTQGSTVGEKKRSDLQNRVRTVNACSDAILLSIHQNHYADSRYSGAQMFWAATEGSQELAKALQSGFVTHLNPDSHRQAKPATGIYLLEHIQCPGVLVECGFLSNAREEALLRTILGIFPETVLSNQVYHMLPVLKVMP